MPVRVLVIGQGLAGSLLAWALHRRGARVRLAEGDLPGGSTAVAAGIINPVTGKRFTLSWRYPEFYPHARDTYRALEQTFGATLWHDYPILRLLGSVQEANDWSARAGLPGLSDYLAESPSGADWAPFLKPGFRYGLIRQAARVDFPLLLQVSKRWAAEQDLLLARAVAPADYETWLSEYDYVISCEGYRGRENPWFAHLPWQLSKGEALLLRFPDARAASIRLLLKKNILVAPLGDGLFWAGSPYEWDFPDSLPSAGGRAFLLDALHDMLAAPFEVVGHVAAVRPTVKDRRPFLGFLPDQPRIGLFNGLGTKGALLAPYWAEHLAEHVVRGTALEAEVDIRRFGQGV